MDRCSRRRATRCVCHRIRPSEGVRRAGSDGGAGECRRRRLVCRLLQLGGGHQVSHPLPPPPHHRPVHRWLPSRRWRSAKSARSPAAIVYWEVLEELGPPLEILFRGSHVSSPSGPPASCELAVCDSAPPLQWKPTAAQRVTHFDPAPEHCCVLQAACGCDGRALGPVPPQPELVRGGAMRPAAAQAVAGEPGLAAAGERAMMGCWSVLEV